MRQGDVAIATIRPPRGEVKVRPAVVVPADAMLVPGAVVRLAGISTSYRPDDEFVVPLPFRPDGNIYTKLRRDSAACAELADNADFADITATGGYVSKADRLRPLELMIKAGTL
jgi:hypothetical protein